MPISLGVNNHQKAIDMSKTFYLPPKDRIGYLTLIILFLLISASAALYQSVFALNESDKLALIEEAFAEHNQTVQAQVREPAILQEPAASTASLKLGTFDPNVASKEELIAQGFSEYAANNLEKYRDKGGEIKQSSDLYKIYGLDSTAIIQMKDRLALPLPNTEIKIEKETNEKYDQKPSPSLAPVEKEEKPQLETFDPNTTSQEKLEQYGLSSYAANNLSKYISKGGRLKEPEDLKRIYGIDDEMYAKVLPYIKIENNDEDVKKEQAYDTTSFVRARPDEKESTTRVVEKENLTLNINEATQEELMKISGIGPAISKGIVKYREMLGGYIEIAQLKEVYNVTEESYQQISQHLFVEGQVSKFYIPSTKFNQVLRHPYIDLETTKIVKGMSIMNYAEDLQALIDDGTIDKRLVPYLYINDPDIE